MSTISNTSSSIVGDDIRASVLLSRMEGNKQEAETLLHGLDPLNSQKQVFIYRAKVPQGVVSRDKIYYDIIDNNGSKIFNAVERNKKLSRNCCNDLRTFHLSLLQKHDSREVLRFERPFKCDCCCCFACLQAMDVLACPDYALIGTVCQEWSICRPRFSIKLPNGEALFRVCGPCCTMRCCVRELNFDVLTNNKLTAVAHISSQWSGLLRDELAEINFFGIEFYKELDSKLKALILGTSFLVNALYYKI